MILVLGVAIIKEASNAASLRLDISNGQLSPRSIDVPFRHKYLPPKLAHQTSPRYICSMFPHAPDPLLYTIPANSLRLVPDL